MLKDIKITLYDIFGYLFPGIVVFIALSIIFWTFLFCSKPITLIELNFELWILVIFASYILGHLVQATGNIIEKKNPRLNPDFYISKSKKDRIPDEIIKKAKSKINIVFNLNIEEIKNLKTRNKWLFRICDETISQYGASEYRDLFVYREGFYRGLTISFFILFASLLLRIGRPEASIKLYGWTLSMNRSAIISFAVIAIIGAILFFHRYQKFYKIRIRQVFLGFLVLQINQISKMKIKEEKKNSNKKSKEIKR